MITIFAIGSRKFVQFVQYGTMASIIGKMRLNNYRSERRAVLLFASGFVVTMLIGQLLEERHCAFDTAGDRSLVNWIGRICSDIRVTSKELSVQGGSLTEVPRRGSLESFSGIPD